MKGFKTASRSAEEMKLASDKIVEAFSVIKNKDGSVNKSGIQQLDAMKWQLAELIVQLMQDQVTLTDPTPFMAEVLTGDIRNQYVWQRVESAIRVVDRAYGSKPQSQRLSFTEYGMTRSHKEVIVEVPLEEIASGRYNPALISEVMAEAVRNHKITALLDALDAGITAVADRTGKAGYVLRYTGLTEGNLKNAINGLQDEGFAPTIFGRHIALAGIAEFPGWSSNGSEAALREIEQRGMVGSYRGANIVSLRDNFNRRTNAHVIRNDRIYMASGQKGMIWMDEDVSFLDFAEVLPAEGVFRVGTRFQYGILRHDPYQYRVITVA